MGTVLGSLNADICITAAAAALVIKLTVVLWVIGNTVSKAVCFCTTVVIHATSCATHAVCGALNIIVGVCNADSADICGCANSRAASTTAVSTRGADHSSVTAGGIDVKGIL